MRSTTRTSRRARLRVETLEHREVPAVGIIAHLDPTEPPLDEVVEVKTDVELIPGEGPAVTFDPDIDEPTGTDGSAPVEEESIDMTGETGEVVDPESIELTGVDETTIPTDEEVATTADPDETTGQPTDPEIFQTTSIDTSAPTGEEVMATTAVSTQATVARRFWFLSSAHDPRRAAAYQSLIGTPGPVTPPTPVTPPATPTLALAAASDTGIVGDNATTLASVGFVGTTSPGATLRITQTGATATADATGAFAFTGVPLAAGANTLTVRARNAAGGTSTFTATVTRSSAPTVAAAPTPVTVAANATSTIDLAGVFTDADITNTLVRVATSSGPVNVELFDKQAPRTVANFLNYATDGDYTDSIFHRRAAGFVLQGGGFTFESAPTPSLAAVPADPAVQNEPDAVNRSNLKGTLAMAKLGGNPNSATNQFFFNLANNSANLDAQNGGFTVFGKVASAADQAVVDALAALPTQNQATATALPPAQQGVFSDIPLPGYTGTSFPTDTTRANYAIVDGITITRQTEALTYSIVSNSDDTVATATLTKNRLAIQGVAAGTTTITIRATDKSGATVDTTVAVTVA